MANDKPKLSGIPGCTFAAILKIDEEKAARTNMNNIKTKPRIDKNLVHLTVSFKKLFEVFFKVNCSNCVIGLFIIIQKLLFNYTQK